MRLMWCCVEALLLVALFHTARAQQPPTLQEIIACAMPICQSSYHVGNYQDSNFGFNPQTSLTDLTEDGHYSSLLSAGILAVNGSQAQMLPNNAATVTLRGPTAIISCTAIVGSVKMTNMNTCAHPVCYLHGLLRDQRFSGNAYTEVTSGSTVQDTGRGFGIIRHHTGPCVKYHTYQDTGADITPENAVCARQTTTEVLRCDVAAPPTTTPAPQCDLCRWLNQPGINERLNLVSHEVLNTPVVRHAATSAARRVGLKHNDSGCVTIVRDVTRGQQLEQEGPCAGRAIDEVLYCGTPPPPADTTTLAVTTGNSNGVDRVTSPGGPSTTTVKVKCDTSEDECALACQLQNRTNPSRCVPTGRIDEGPLIGQVAGTVDVNPDDHILLVKGRGCYNVYAVEGKRSQNVVGPPCDVAPAPIEHITRCKETTAPPPARKLLSNGRGSGGSWRAPFIGVVSVSGVLAVLGYFFS